MILWRDIKLPPRFGAARPADDARVVRAKAAVAAAFEGERRAGDQPETVGAVGQRAGRIELDPARDGGVDGAIV